MKKYLFALGLLFQAGISFSQKMQASIGAGSAQNRVKIYLKSDVALSPANISTLQFNIGIATSITPKPTATIVGNSFAGSTWTVETAEDGGYYNFLIQTSTSPLNPNLTTAEFEALEVEFTGGPVGLNDVSLVTLPDGGTGASQGKALFLCTGTNTNSDGSSLYFTRTGITVTNTFSYDITGSASGTGTSFATVGDINLPVKFLSFYALKSGSDAKLTWTVENDADNKYFDVERSIDGRTYTSFTRVNALGNGKSVNTYETSDNGILNGSAVYYRIKQVDLNGTVSYSLIRDLKLDKNLTISLYPNPARNITKLVLDAPTAGKASVSIRDAAGKQVQLVSLQLVKGINQHNLNIQTLPAGEYNVTIIGEKLSQTIKLSKIN